MEYLDVFAPQNVPLFFKGLLQLFSREFFEDEFIFFKKNKLPPPAQKSGASKRDRL